MKSKSVNFYLLLVCLMLNIVFTQKMVHQFKFENFDAAIVYCLLNIIVFPIALFIYKKDKKQSDVRTHE